MASLSGATTSRTLLDIIPQYSKSKIEVGSVRLKSIVSVGNAQNATSRFPKLEECAHFHYDHVDLQPIQPVMSLPQLLVTQEDCPRGDFEGITLKVTSGNETWQVRRTYEHFCKLDEQLHQCVFDRKFSKLPVLCQQSPNSNAEVLELLNRYVKRLSVIGSGCAISCGPVLSWFEIDNRGRRLVAAGHGINTPAVAAAFATTPYTAHATDELSFQIGDMISVIDMPPAEESSWWRGKRGFVVGFFPSNCVAVITDKIPHEIAIAEPNKPVLRKHGKLIAFFRAFILSRPSRRRLKQSGILKERVFGCDLSEHLLNSGREIPLVLKCCAEFIEAHGIVDGIYRLSGVTSNIQRLRSIFDEDRVPVLEEDSGIKQDIHGVASLLKMYFRELPNPLCTYQLYDEFVAAVQSPLDQRLEKMRNVVQKLPPPHYRTLKYLMGHLGRVCGHSTGTGMTARNVAIVWAPNLLRCRSLDQGVAALQGVGVQAVVTEFLILYSPAIFGENVHLRPKSLAVNSPTKLLSLEEAQARGQSSPIQPYVPPEVATTERASSEPNYHTVIELPRKRQPLNWRTIFTPRRSNLQVKSPRRLKMKTAVKSAEFLGCGSGGVLVCTPLPVSGPPTSTHSRSVSHDSYFDTAAIDHHRSSSSLVETQHEGLSLSLDLSELQMNFDTEESEMRIFSEDETNQLFSSGASIAFGVLESCESNLEQRFSNQELRFIDSYSPDAMESPSDEDAFSPPGGGGGVNYRALTTPSSSGDNNNVGGAVLSAGTASSSRRSVEISPFSYEKLADTPSVTEKKENDLYESCVPSGRHTYETMELETEAYEPVSTAPQTSSHLYQNEEMVKSAQEDLDQNIYEDVQQCTPPADIYEQVSNFRNSVNEVNRLVVDNNSPSSSAEEKTEMKKEFSIYVDIDKENREDLAKEYDGRGEEGERAKRSDYEVVSFTSGRENVVPAKQNEIKNKPDDDKADCDSKLSVFRDNIETAPVTICEVLDKSSVEETIKKTSPSKPACSVISEVLKRDWVGRSKDTSSSQKPVPPSSLPLVKTEEDDFGKTEKLRKIFERGSACAKSPVNEAQQRLSPLSVEAIIKEELMKNPQGSESEAERRERIEKYKEERRNFFRNKYKTDTLNNNEDRDDDLIRRIKQRTKVKERSDESLGGQISPTMRRRSSVETDSKKSPTKVTVNISYSPTKSKAPSEMGVSPVERRRADSLPLRERRREDSFK